MGRVIVVGSVNVDLVVSVGRLPRAGETVAGGTFARHGGGKGANQAVAAARLGAEVAMVGAVGADDMGDEALAELAAEGIDTTYVARLDDVPTGVAAIVVDEAGENQIAVASGANAALDAAAVERALAALLDPEPSTTLRKGSDPFSLRDSDLKPSTTLRKGSDPFSLRDSDPKPSTTLRKGSDPLSGADSDLACAGVVLLVNEVPAKAVAAGIRAARAAGWLVVLNPAPARPAEAELAGVVLTPNEDEARELAGAGEVEKAARVLAGETGAPVLVTLGADGALLVDGDDATRLSAPAVSVVDTTGAGDTVNGALAAELAAGRPLEDALRFALAAAALSTTAAGARTAMPSRDEVLASR